MRTGDHADRDDLVRADDGNLPDWADDAADMWAAADEYERANGRLYVEVEVALPRELSLEQQVAAVREMVHRTTHAEGLPYSWAIHCDPHGNNPHAHILIQERVYDGVERTRETHYRRANRRHPERGGAAKSMSLRHRDNIVAIRARWADVANAALARAGSNARIDHRSHIARGIRIPPQIHLGPSACALIARGEPSARLSAWEAIDTARYTMRSQTQAPALAIATLEVDAASVAARDLPDHTDEWRPTPPTPPPASAPASPPPTPEPVLERELAPTPTPPPIPAPAPTLAPEPEPESDPGAQAGVWDMSDNAAYQAAIAEHRERQRAREAMPDTIAAINRTAPAKPTGADGELPPWRQPRWQFAADPASGNHAIVAIIAIDEDTRGITAWRMPGRIDPVDLVARAQELLARVPTVDDLARCHRDGSTALRGAEFAHARSSRDRWRAAQRPTPANRVTPPVRVSKPQPKPAPQPQPSPAPAPTPRPDVVAYLERTRARDAMPTTIAAINRTAPAKSTGADGELPPWRQPRWQFAVDPSSPYHAVVDVIAIDETARRVTAWRMPDRINAVDLVIRAQELLARVPTVDDLAKCHTSHSTALSEGAYVRVRDAREQWRAAQLSSNVDPVTPSQPARQPKPGPQPEPEPEPQPQPPKHPTAREVVDRIVATDPVIRDGDVRSEFRARAYGYLRAPYLVETRDLGVCCIIEQTILDSDDRSVRIIPVPASQRERITELAAREDEFKVFLEVREERLDISAPSPSRGLSRGR